MISARPVAAHDSFDAARICSDCGQYWIEHSPRGCPDLNHDDYPERPCGPDPEDER